MKFTYHYFTPLSTVSLAVRFVPPHSPTVQCPASRSHRLPMHHGVAPPGNATLQLLQRIDLRQFEETIRHRLRPGSAPTFEGGGDVEEGFVEDETVSDEAASAAPVDAGPASREIAPREIAPRERQQGSVATASGGGSQAGRAAEGSQRSGAVVLLLRARAFLLYHFLPYDKSVFGRLGCSQARCRYRPMSRIRRIKRRHVTVAMWQVAVLLVALDTIPASPTRYLPPSGRGLHCRPSPPSLSLSCAPASSRCCSDACCPSLTNSC